jgi:bacteriocin-like protein
MSMTTDSNEQVYEASPAERDADELTDCELECVSGGDVSPRPNRPL